MNDLFQRDFLGNTIESYCWFLGIILLGLLFKRMLSNILTRFIYRFIKPYAKGIGIDSLIDLLKKPGETFILLITIYLAFDRLEFPHEWRLVPREQFGARLVVFKIFQAAIIISLTWIVMRIIDFFGLVMRNKAVLAGDKSDNQLIPFVKEFLKIILGIISFFFILGQVCEVNVASLVAGLGIGGLAIALAAKESLENLLGSFTIFFDKPFMVGDLVQFGNITGHVERIGFRSTRIRTLEKSFVTVPNKKLVESELDNLSLRTYRRAHFFVHLIYGTNQEKLKAIVQDLQQALNEHPKIVKEENRVRIYELTQSSIDIMVSYYVNTMEWDVYIDVREQINFHIIATVRKHGSDFAINLPK